MALSMAKMAPFALLIVSDSLLEVLFAYRLHGAIDSRVRARGFGRPPGSTSDP